MEKTHDEEMAIDLWELISALKKRDYEEKSVNMIFYDKNER